MEWWGSDYVQTSLNHFQDCHTKGFSLMTMSMNPGYFRRKQKENGGKRTSFPLSFPPGPSCSNIEPVSKLSIWVSGASHMRMRNKQLGKESLQWPLINFHFFFAQTKQNHWLKNYALSINFDRWHSLPWIQKNNAYGNQEGCYFLWGRRLLSPFVKHTCELCLFTVHFGS